GSAGGRAIARASRHLIRPPAEPVALIRVPSPLAAQVAANSANQPPAASARQAPAQAPAAANSPGEPAPPEPGPPPPHQPAAAPPAPARLRAESANRLRGLGRPRSIPARWRLLPGRTNLAAAPNSAQ